jgi:hypothetical protein
MAFKTITARFDGTCKRCSTPIAAGTRMRWGGRGRTYHLLADCPAATASNVLEVGEAEELVTSLRPAAAAWVQ